MSYPNERTDNEILYGSRNHIIVPNTVTITFNFDIELTDRKRSIVTNIGRTLIKKKLSMLKGTKVLRHLYNT